MGQTGSIVSQIWRTCNRLRSLRIKTLVTIWFVTTCSVFCRGHMLIQALTSFFSHWSISIGPGSRRLTMIRLLGALSQATAAFWMNTSQRMPSFSLGKSGANICGSKVSQSTLMRDCKTRQHPLASTCHRLTLNVKSKPSGSSVWVWSVEATAPIWLTTWVEAKLFSLQASTTKSIQDAGNQTNKESTELLPPSVVSNRASVGFLQPCFWAPSKGRQTTFTNPVGGLCFSCSFTALCRLEAHNNSV